MPGGRYATASLMAEPRNNCLGTCFCLTVNIRHLTPRKLLASSQAAPWPRPFGADSGRSLVLQPHMCRPLPCCVPQVPPRRHMSLSRFASIFCDSLRRPVPVEIDGHTRPKSVSTMASFFHGHPQAGHTRGSTSGPARWRPSTSPVQSTVVAALGQASVGVPVLPASGRIAAGCAPGQTSFS